MPQVASIVPTAPKPATKSEAPALRNSSKDWLVDVKAMYDIDILLAFLTASGEFKGISF